MLAETATGTKSASQDAERSEVEFQRLKTAVHEELIESLDLSVLGEMDHDFLVAEIAAPRRGNLPGAGQTAFRRGAPAAGRRTFGRDLRSGSA